MYKACVIVLSDRKYTGEEEDSKDKKLENYLRDNNFEILEYKIIPEIQTIYKEFLLKCCDNYYAELVVTIGNKELSEQAAKEISDEKNKDFNSYKRKKTIIKNLEEGMIQKDKELKNLIKGIKYIR